MFHRSICYTFWMVCWKFTVIHRHFLVKLVCIFEKHLTPVPECKVELLFLENKYPMAHAAAGFLPEQEPHWSLCCPR